MAAAVAAAASVPAAVPVSDEMVSLRFKPVGWASCSGSVKPVMYLPATNGPTMSAMKMTSITKKRMAKRITRLFLSFDCFKE